MHQRWQHGFIHYTWQIVTKQEKAAITDSYVELMSKKKEKSISNFHVNSRAEERLKGSYCW